MLAITIDGGTERDIVQPVASRQKLRAQLGDERFFLGERRRHAPFPYRIHRALRDARLQRPVDPGTPLVRRIERARADERYETPHAQRQNGFVSLATRMEIVAEVSDACRQIGAACHRHDEWTAYRPAPDGAHGVVEAALVFRKRLARYRGNSAHVWLPGGVARDYSCPP